MYILALNMHQSARSWNLFQMTIVELFQNKQEDTVLMLKRIPQEALMHHIQKVN